MCLGVPGKIIEIYRSNELLMCKVDFGGVVREVCLETLPEAKVGDYTIVHAGLL
jgi:hydrogenase expression/formation protein HypC